MLPEFREYERLSSTLINAFLAPVARDYFARFEENVRSLDIGQPPMVMISGGGVATPAAAGERPIDTLFSGPSGGVSGALYEGLRAGHANLITFDMGGTSTDVCLVQDGKPETTYARVIDGLPLRAPALDVHTVGAGGSSIAAVDDGGLLQVGPQSAGAKPGPACYGSGGDRPTVTDANVVLGRLNPRHLLGRALRIDAALSHTAIERHVARPKGMEVTEAAASIVALANVNMAQAVRFVSVERGLDPRDFLLVAFGGAGPLHAVEVARDLSMSGVLVPVSPGVLCAMGVLTKDVEVEISQTRILRDGDPDFHPMVHGVYADLERRARAALAAQGMPLHRISTRRSVDARYTGQNYELPITVASRLSRPSSLPGRWPAARCASCCATSSPRGPTSPSFTCRATASRRRCVLSSISSSPSSQPTLLGSDHRPELPSLRPRRAADPAIERLGNICKTL